MHYIKHSGNNKNDPYQVFEGSSKKLHMYIFQTTFQHEDVIVTVFIFNAEHHYCLIFGLIRLKKIHVFNSNPKNFMNEYQFNFRIP